MASEWKRGAPRDYTGDIHDYDVAFAVIGGIWHRRRSPEEKRAGMLALAANRRACGMHTEADEIERRLEPARTA